MFGFGKKKAPTWKDLSHEQKRFVTGRIAKSIVALSGARYKVVSGDDQFQREHGIAEHEGEDWVLNASRRMRLLNLARNQMRNSPTFVGIMKQFDLNAVGTQGGKATFAFDDMEKAKRLRAEFSKWTRDAEFYDGLSLNSLLKVILRTYLIGGDAVLLFDDGLIEDSGRVVMYEPDMIGDTTKDAIVKHFGKGAKQSLGRVVNSNGRFQGVVVSRSQRGQELFDPKKCYFLTRDPQQSQLDSLWMMPRNVWRVEQGRGYPQVASSLATTIDLEDLCSYELASAKANSQTLAQVIQEAQQEEEVLPSAFDSNTDFSSMTEAEINAAIEAEKSIEEQTVTLSKMKSAGCIYESLPQGFKLELLDTRHPNAAMPEFIRWLAGRAASPYGLGQIYATLKADSSYTAFRGEQLLSWQSFYEAQKFLESICDWIVYRWAIWAEKKGLVEADVFEDDWIHKVSWQWARMKEVDEVSNQNAINLKLKNGTGTYKDILGSSWAEQLQQTEREIQWCREHNIPHPALQTVNGSIIESNIAIEKKNKETEDNE